MRLLRISIAASLVTVVALLALGVLDFCRVTDDGTVVWEPRLRTAAVRRYGAALWRAGTDAVAPDPPAPADTAAAPRR